jgi:ribonuclease E
VFTESFVASATNGFGGPGCPKESHMLDTDAPVPPVDDAAGASPAPQTPRRRRAASRPAGPPAAVTAAEPHPELPPAPTPPELENTEPETVEADVVEIVDLVEEEVVEPEPIAEIPAAEEPPAAARRAPRKRSSRPAGPPADAPVVAEAPAEAVVEAPEAVVEAPAAPKRRRRRASDAAEVVADAETAPEDSAEPLDAVEASLVALEEARPRRRPTRRRPADTEDDAPDVASALDSLAAAIASGAHPAGEPVGNADADEDADLTEDEEDDSDPARRRRRRRGGRRRRRGTSDRVGEEQDEPESEDDAADLAENAEGAEGEPEGEAGQGVLAAEGTARRRRRRRRRGEDAGDEAAEDGVDVVVRVREPRRTRVVPERSDQVTGIEGSTRMEAKKQRRREGRAAGRRRAPILSEAEFLARREAVDRRMLIRQRDAYTQIGVLEDGILVEHYVDRDNSASMIGNIYLGRVQNVLPSMEAAFVDIGRGRNAVLYAGEVDWEHFGVTGSERKVERVLKSGQAVLVQVSKDPVGAKGARLTSHISIPGRYVVYSPGGQLSGISRKLPENERQRLKGILDELVGENASVIVRTAAEGASEEELVRDVNRLKAQWEVIEKKVAQGNSPQMLYSEPDLTVRIVRDLFTEDFAELIVDANESATDAYDTVQAYVTHVAPHLQERLVKWNRWTQGDLFEQHRVDEQVSKALERKVHLPSGGSLVIDRTEAMTVVDVNTGKFTGTQGNLEATVTSNNLEAAEEIVRQLRLRDIGGIIVIDFIDMVLPANRELLLRRLVECLGRDRTRHQVAEVTSLGLVQMTRKKIGTGLAEAFSIPCETCSGRGYHIHEAPVSSQAPADGGDRDHSYGPQRRHRGPATQGPPA